MPIDLNTPALTTFHAQHASLRQTAARLENQLGPRHPRLAGARAAIEAARQDIAAELRRIVQGAQSELRRAVRTEQELAARVARAKATRSDQSEALVGLRELQAEAEAARAIYGSALLRAGETGEIGALGTVNAAILSRAEPPLTASSVSRRTIAVAFTLAGLLVGLALAVAAGLKNAVSFAALGGGASVAPPDDPDPEGPAPNRNARQETDTMYPGYPYALSPFASQPVPHPHPVAQGAPHPHAPQPVPARHYAAPPAPMPPPAPEAYWPQPVPYPAPGAPHAAPVPQAPHWQPPYPQAMPPAPARNAPAPAGDLDELRRSIDDIRAVVDELAARRDNVRRYG